MVLDGKGNLNTDKEKSSFTTECCNLAGEPHQKSKGKKCDLVFSRH